MTDSVAVALIAAVPATAAVLLGIANRVKLGTVSLQIDGRLTELLALTKEASFAEGAKDAKDHKTKPKRRNASGQ